MSSEIVIREIDFRIIRRLREARILSGKTQLSLAQDINVSEGFIGNLENLKQPKKLNLNLIHKITKGLNLKSYSDLLPQVIVENDYVRIQFETLRIPKEKEVDENGNVIENIKITSFKEISLSEVEKLKEDKKKGKHKDLIIY
tara:strand:+ start:780 stop:1208 length:429 start_codon:yes stop_codon:yes gene_type:complete